MCPDQSNDSYDDAQPDPRVAFHAPFYRLMNPDAALRTDSELRAEYERDGWRDLRDPSPFFCVATYLDLNPDVRDGGVEPLAHYRLSGGAEGRIAHLSAWGETPVERVNLHDLEACRPWIDVGRLRAARPDWAALSDDAFAAWYLTAGWREGLDPSERFSMADYLAVSGDIAELGVCPLLHYVRFGRAEGRDAGRSGAVRLTYDPAADLTPDFPMTLPRDGPRATPPASTDAHALNIHWVIPDFMAGSGGHMTIFRMVRFLEVFGHSCTIWIEKPVFNDTPQDAWEVIIKAFQCIKAQVRFVDDAMAQASGDVVIAAGWSTAWLVRDLCGFTKRMYFVQDHEPEFYPTGALSRLAQDTYGFDLGCICASAWLETLMRDTYGRWAKGFHLAYDPQVYVDIGTREAREGPVRLAVYCRARTERRCVELALAGLQELAALRDDFEVHFFGQDDVPFEAAPFAAFNHGVLGDAALADLYNACDIGICFSGTNHSLVPQEMMACGLPVLELDGPSTRAIFPDGVVRLTAAAPDAVAGQIGAMIDAPEVRKAQAQAALHWVSGFSWEDSARAVESAIFSYLGVSKKAPYVGRSKDLVLDVVIPTFNGLAEIESVLAALRGQRVADQMQIYCVDSSSTDGTTQWLRAQRDVSLTVIDTLEFQHGRTRNLGASLGAAPLVGFLTQDAQPATQDWATDLAMMMQAVPEAAGVFGRHIGYPDHPAYVRDEITRHFANLARHPLVLSKETDRAAWDAEDIAWRQVLHFYSNNNSAMRRHVWQDFPFPEVAFGEDQLWAREIIEAGLSKVYAPTATVYHSHDFTPPEAYARAKTEGRFFKEHFGYRIDAAVAPVGMDAAVWTQRQQGWQDGQSAVC